MSGGVGTLVVVRRRQKKASRPSPCHERTTTRVPTPPPLRPRPYCEKRSGHPQRGALISFSAAVKDRCLCADEGHAVTRSELNIRHIIGVATPIHIAGDHVAIPQNLFYHRDMPKVIGALHPGL